MGLGGVQLPSTLGLTGIHLLKDEGIFLASEIEKTAKQKLPDHG